jgi:DNA-directed RNA polymerase subunit beta
VKFATPIFDGATIEEILNDTRQSRIASNTEELTLYDGGTGEKFDQPATVGIIYMLKLGSHG